jgi:hypothetical protein
MGGPCQNRLKKLGCSSSAAIWTLYPCGLSSIEERVTSEGDRTVSVRDPIRDRRSDDRGVGYVGLMIPGLGATSEDRKDPDYSAWRRRRINFTITTLVVMVLPIPVFIVADVTIRAAAIQGFLVGYMVLVSANSFAEVFIPWRYERWRSWMMEGSPSSYRQIGKVFDGALVPGEDDHRYRRLRWLGLGLFLMNALLVGVIWWICSIAGWI